jgi:hypothetical protein
MSLLSRFFSGGYTSEAVGGRQAEVEVRRLEVERRIAEADGRIVEEMLQDGVSPSARQVEELRRELGQLTSAWDALEQERRVLVETETAARIEKQWKVSIARGQELEARARNIESVIDQLRRLMEGLLTEADKFIAGVPALPPGFQDAEPLEGSLISGINYAIHGDAYRATHPRASLTEAVHEVVAHAIKDRPQPVTNLGTRALLGKPETPELHNATN